MSMREPGRSGRSTWRPIEWILGILGGIASFLGFFILFGPDEEYVGLGGDLSWQVGGISDAWALSLMIGGLVLLAVALGIVIYDRLSPSVPVPRMASARADLYTHAGIFLVVNAYIWVQDIAIGGGVDYAFWVTIPWGIGLLAHAVAHYFGASRTESVPPVMEEKEQELLHH